MSSNYQEDLAHIRNMMEKSSRFISLSGLSGIFAGTFALIGAAIAYYLLQAENINYFEGSRNFYSTELSIVQNLTSHIKTLEKNKYIEIKKEFVGKKPRTTYRVTRFGKESFQKHINALENLLN